MNNDEELMRAFRIGSEDLEANRQGRLGPGQRRSLLKSGNWNVAGAFFIGLLLGAILYGVAAKPLAPVQWILCILLFAAALAVGIRYFRRTRAAAAEGRVESVVGPVQVASRGTAGWYLSVGGRSFRLPIRPWHIQSGAAYRVYIEPRTRNIVAMELTA
jgi:hypothetical protein